MKYQPATLNRLNILGIIFLKVKKQLGLSEVFLSYCPGLRFELLKFSETVTNISKIPEKRVITDYCDNFSDIWDVNYFWLKSSKFSGFLLWYFVLNRTWVLTSGCWHFSFLTFLQAGELVGQDVVPFSLVVWFPFAPGALKLLPSPELNWCSLRGQGKDICDNM